MRSTNDPIAGIKQKLLDWEVVTEEELKAIDKEVRAHVDNGGPRKHSSDFVRGYIQQRERAAIP